MFVRGRNTFVARTSITLDSGITSLVLVPLPATHESVEDVGPHLHGASIGSAVLAIPPELEVMTTSTSSECLSAQFQGVFSSSPLSSPPDSEHESERAPQPVDQKVHWQPLADPAFESAYTKGRSKMVYKTNKKYLSFETEGSETLSSPPAPPDGTVVLPHSIWSHAYDDHPRSSSKNMQHWVYIPQARGTSTWEPNFTGFPYIFNGVPYHIQWREGKGASWVKGA